MNVEVTGRCFQVDEYCVISLPLVNKAANRGEPRQLLCSEMLHWDDYRQDRGVNDGKPPMKQLFASTYEEPTLRSFFIGTEPHMTQMTSISGVQAGSPKQMFCAEMQHWDDYCAARGITTGAPTMVSLYSPFDSKIFLVFDLADHKLIELHGNSVALREYAAARQTFCSEMDHWDEYVQQKTGVLTQPNMTSLFA